MRRALALAMALASLALPAAADANGDPASDVLLLQDAYFPYEPKKVPKPVEDALTRLLDQSREKGYPLKVAIIASEEDLGNVPQFFGAPQPYAQHLGGEIAFNEPKPLLVVQPSGYGIANAGPKGGEALEGLDRPDSDSGDALARAAIEGTLRLAKANGVTLPEPKLPPAADEGGGTSPAVYLVPVLLLALGGGLAALRARLADDDAA